MQHSDCPSRGGQPAEPVQKEVEATAAIAEFDPSGDGSAPVIGYGKPPCGKRFQPGRSGNPKGRPRNDQAFKTLLQRELEERVSVKEQGRRRKLSKRGVIVKRLVSEAMAGNPKHLAIVLSQDPVAAEVLDQVTAALARPADALVKAALIQRLRAVAGLEGEPPDRLDPLDADRVEEGA